jgi:cytochrome c oxidase cbb3-type subunit 3
MVFLAMLRGSAYLGLGQQSSAQQSSVQQPSAQQPPEEAGRPRPVGGFVPGSVRPPIDPAVVARGKTLYGINCQGCHGPDLRGGDMGGPNLLRSQVALSDQDGELIVPIIQGARQSMGMPRIPLSIEDSKTVAAYVRSVIATIGRQGTPPEQKQPPSILTGDAAAGQVYFGLKCAQCHSPQVDLQGVASRVSNPKALQNLWVAGAVRGLSNPAAVVTATVTFPSGETVQGQLTHLDDFLITLKLSDGLTRSFRRNGNLPRILVRDPLQAHKDLLPVYTDKDIHDVTAYLVTLK